MTEKAIEAAARAMMELRLWKGAFDEPQQWQGVDSERMRWVELARAAIAAYERAMWQPIESAPKDSTDITLWAAGRPIPRTGAFIKGSIMNDGEDVWMLFWWRVVEPTHWRPLTPPPENEK